MTKLALPVRERDQPLPDVGFYAALCDLLERSIATLLAEWGGAE